MSPSVLFCFFVFENATNQIELCLSCMDINSIRSSIGNAYAYVREAAELSSSLHCTAGCCSAQPAERPLRWATSRVHVVWATSAAL